MIGIGSTRFLFLVLTCGDKIPCRSNIRFQQRTKTATAKATYQVVRQNSLKVDGKLKQRRDTSGSYYVLGLLLLLLHDAGADGDDNNNNNNKCIADALNPSECVHVIIIVVVVVVVVVVAVVVIKCFMIGVNV